MYLYRQQYASPTSGGSLKITRKGKTTAIRPEQPTYLKEQVGYWRKANQIHGWFVDNVQGGEDDCREHYVDHDDLCKLNEAVNEVLANCKLAPGVLVVGQTLENEQWVDITKDGLVVADTSVAKRLLPVRDGFFFGSRNYDQFYLDDLRYTQQLLTELLALPPDVDFTYRASW